MNVLPRRRRRHWKQRFDPDARFVFRRPCRLGTTDFAVFDPVPEGLDPRLLRKLWNANRIELEAFVAPALPISREGRLVEAIAALDAKDSSHFTKTGLPRVEVLEERLGHDIAAAERDAAWASFLERRDAA